MIQRIILLFLCLDCLAGSLRAEERVFDGWKEAVIWITRPSANFQVSAAGSPFGFDLDFPMQGALALADQNVRLSTKPKGFKMSMKEPDGMLKARITNGELRFDLKATQGKIMEPMRIETRKGPFRLVVRQLDQVALYVISGDVSSVTQVWCGDLDYRVKLRSADIYILCDKVEVRMGERKWDPKDLAKGLLLDHLDELGDIVIEGLDPQKKPFLHRYTFDLKQMDETLVSVFQSIFPGPEGKKAKEEKKPNEA